jgi:hypothetical protein
MQSIPNPHYRNHCRTRGWQTQPTTLREIVAASIGMGGRFQSESAAGLVGLRNPTRRISFPGG